MEEKVDVKMSVNVVLDGNRVRAHCTDHRDWIVDDWHYHACVFGACRSACVAKGACDIIQIDDIRQDVVDSTDYAVVARWRFSNAQIERRRGWCHWVLLNAYGDCQNALQCEGFKRAAWYNDNEGLNRPTCEDGNEEYPLG